MFDLAAALPNLLPSAIAWSEARSREIAATGTPLNAMGIRLARAVAVARPELIRVLEVSALPLPEDPELRFAALQTGFLGPSTIGLTLGHGIYIIRGHGSARLLSHECRHVYQYEMAGSVALFLPTYLQQIATVGYEHAPLEVDARNHEIDVA
jgi:hypothetical protein